MTYPQRPGSKKNFAQSPKTKIPLTTTVLSLRQARGGIASASTKNKIRKVLSKREIVMRKHGREDRQPPPTESGEDEKRH